MEFNHYPVMLKENIEAFKIYMRGHNLYDIFYGPHKKREKEILTCVSRGDTNSQIAEKLFVREVTVKTHLNSIYRKLKVDNRVQAVLLAQQTGII